MNTEIGLIGLGVMGKSLSRNIASKGFKISIFNRHVSGKEEGIARNAVESYPELKDAIPFDDLKLFVQSLESPRKIVLMVNAGSAVDAVLNDLVQVLDPGDIVIDGGNSHFEDTSRRIEELRAGGLYFIGSGISGGEEGALVGPSIMPSGDQRAFEFVKPYLEKIAALDDHGKPCCAYVGKKGSGHFVKMIHNGIEYAEMQLLAECYYILKKQGMSNEEIANAFSTWKQHVGGYLLDITIDILKKKEGDDYLLDLILDKAGNKGTGKWATVSIADFGEPATMIPSALFARYLSSFKDRREGFAKVFPSEKVFLNIPTDELKEAYQFARIINHYQGFSMIQQTSDNQGWSVNLSEIARIWTGGCIIKSDLMKEISKNLRNQNNLLLNEDLQFIIKGTHQSAKFVASSCLKAEIHAPCLIEAVNYFHGLKTAISSANLIQAQRDFFGAHTYQRVDDPEGAFYHTEW